MLWQALFILWPITMCNLNLCCHLMKVHEAPTCLHRAWKRLKTWVCYLSYLVWAQINACLQKSVQAQQSEAIKRNHQKTWGWKPLLWPPLICTDYVAPEAARSSRSFPEVPDMSESDKGWASATPGQVSDGNRWAEQIRAHFYGSDPLPCSSSRGLSVESTITGLLASTN